MIDGVEVAILEEHVVQGAVEAGTVDPEAARGISLGVKIDDEDPLAGEGKSGREIDYGRRLADAAFLVGTGDRLTHSGPPKRSAHEHPFYQLGPFDPRDSRFLQGPTTPSSGGYARLNGARRPRVDSSGTDAPAELPIAGPRRWITGPAGAVSRETFGLTRTGRSSGSHCPPGAPRGILPRNVTAATDRQTSRAIWARTWLAEDRIVHDPARRRDRSDGDRHR